MLHSQVFNAAIRFFYGHAQHLVWLVIHFWCMVKFFNSLVVDHRNGENIGALNTSALLYIYIQYDAFTTINFPIQVYMKLFFFKGQVNTGSIVFYALFMG